MATKLSLSWSSWTSSSCSWARSIAIATRSATSWSSSTSSRVNCRGVSVPTWRTPSDAPRDEQRHAEHRLEVLLAQDRVVDRVLVDVDDHRPRLGGDAAREARAERDPDRRPPPRSRAPRARRARSTPRRAGGPRTCRCGGCRGSSAGGRASSSFTSRCASAASVTACTCSIRSRAARSASKRRACSIASAARSADELEQLDLVLLEGAVDERADVEHAAHLALDDERDAEHRLDPLLPQDRVEDVRVVDVVEDHRLLLGGDPAREAAADRDADALLDLLLDPERGARDELVRLLVEEEDRARVDARASGGCGRAARRGARRDEDARGPRP